MQPIKLKDWDYNKEISELQESVDGLKLAIEELKQEISFLKNAINALSTKPGSPR